MISERGGCVEGEWFARQGMAERQVFGMQVQAVGLLAVKGIAEDGTVETLAVGTVHAQLVGAARERGEGQARVGAFGGKHLIEGHGLLAARKVDHLTRAVERVGAQGEADPSPWVAV